MNTATEFKELLDQGADMAIIEAQAAAKATTTHALRNGRTYYFEDDTACRFFDAGWAKGGRAMRTLTDDA